MNAVYVSALNAFLAGDIDATAVTLKAQLVEGYVHGAAHDTLADVGAGTRVGDAVALSAVAVAGGGLTCDPVTFELVAIGHTIDGVVVYVDDGSGESCPLVAYIDRRADTVPLVIETLDGDIVLTWPSTLLKI